MYTHTHTPTKNSLSGFSSDQINVSPFTKEMQAILIIHGFCICTVAYLEKMFLSPPNQYSWHCSAYLRTCRAVKHYSHPTCTFPLKVSAFANSVFKAISQNETTINNENCLHEMFKL